MKFNLTALIIIIICSGFFSFYSRLYAKEISYYVKPLRVEKGEILLVIFQNLDKEKKYVLRAVTDKNYNYPLDNIEEYTLKLIGVPLSSPDTIKIDLLENGEPILEDEIRLHKIKREVIPITVKDEYVIPPKSFLNRIWEDNQKKEKAKNIGIKQLFISGGPMFPVTNGSIGTTFGWPRNYNKKLTSIHYGVDISAPYDTPIKAPFNGKVILAGEQYYAGNTVMLHHGGGLITTYAHMHTILVAENQIVEKGRTIGLVGSTGRSTGPHLHWGAYVDGIAVDPMALFKILNVK